MNRHMRAFALLWLVALVFQSTACNKAADYAFAENDLSALKSYRQRQMISVQEEGQAAEAGRDAARERARARGAAT